MNMVIPRAAPAVSAEHIGKALALMRRIAVGAQTTDPMRVARAEIKGLLPPDALFEGARRDAPQQGSKTDSLIAIEQDWRKLPGHPQIPTQSHSR
jgi:hypothetical protein